MQCIRIRHALLPRPPRFRGRHPGAPPRLRDGAGPAQHAPPIQRGVVAHANECSPRALTCATLGLVSLWPFPWAAWFVFCAGAIALFLRTDVRALGPPHVLAACALCRLSKVAAVWLVSGANDLCCSSRTSDHREGLVATSDGPPPWPRIWTTPREDVVLQAGQGGLTAEARLVWIEDARVATHPLQLVPHSHRAAHASIGLARLGLDEGVLRTWCWTVRTRGPERRARPSCRCRLPRLAAPRPRSKRRAGSAPRGRRGGGIGRVSSSVVRR